MRIFGMQLFVVVLALGWNHLDALDTKLMKICVSKKTCESCLETNSYCAWCSDWSYSNYTMGKPRCNLPESLEAFGCNREEIRRASKGSKKVLENHDFQNVIGSDQAPVQLKPQKIEVRIQPRTKISIPLHYRLAKNYPLDLYYLMDLTLTMQDDQITLVRLAWNITHTLRMFTENYRLGFGSYADKPLMPLVFSGHQDNPCKSAYKDCEPLYAFRHRLSLTSDIQQFIEKIEDSRITGNVDNLEAGMDAVAQAIVCAEKIGWGYQSRKIILMATDGLLHFAGDGKLTGTVDRSDFQCHLDENGMYTMSEKFDYPSLAEVSRLLRDNKVNLIFAVTEDRRLEYELMVDLLQEKARVATLAQNSSNILQIINNAYHELITKVVLRDNSTSPLRVEYFSNCGRTDEEKISTSECRGIEEGKVYDFSLVLSFDECPRNESALQQRIVIEDALASEASKIVIDVELLCGCKCKDSVYSRCVHGSDECGFCKCHFGWSGEYCDCNQISPVDNEQQCIAPTATTICSNRGECICGSCICDEEYSGRFCECSPCEQSDGLECGGKGICDCGTCSCLPGWKGDTCECPTMSELCMAPGSEHICSGNGDCDCGECRCKSVNNVDYSGKYCELSISSVPNSLCALYNGCVNATIEEPQRIDENCRTNKTDYNTTIIGSVDRGHEHYCFVRTVKEDLVCTIPYVYEFQTNDIVLLKIGEKVCSRPLQATAMFGCISLAIVVLGMMVVMIWRVWTFIQDRQEFAKFQLEQSRTVFSSNQNPLYKSATYRYEVPQMLKED
nr:integrin beta-nu-like [Megalopta genalis]